MNGGVQTTVSDTSDAQQRVCRSKKRTAAAYGGPLHEWFQGVVHKEDISQEALWICESNYPFNVGFFAEDVSFARLNIHSPVVQSGVPKVSGWTEFDLERSITEPFEGLGNSTGLLSHSEEIDKEIEMLFQSAKEQSFEYGIESDFSQELVFFVKKYGDVAIDAITNLLLDEGVNPEVAWEALRCLGDIHHQASHLKRLWLLERCLNSSSRWIRDGAALGLASMDDPHAINYLKSAAEREPLPGLREDLEQVVLQLEETQRATSPEVYKK